MTDLISVADYKKRADQILPRNVRENYNGGSENEFSLRQNCSAFEKYIYLGGALVE